MCSKYLVFTFRLKAIAPASVRGKPPSFCSAPRRRRWKGCSRVRTTRIQPTMLRQTCTRRRLCYAGLAALFLAIPAAIIPAAIYGSHVRQAKQQSKLQAGGDTAGSSSTTTSLVDPSAPPRLNVNTAILPNGRPNPCSPSQFQWPLESPDVYCWMRRDSDGVPQNPGNNVWTPNNAYVTNTGQLVLQVVKDGTGTFSSGEVYLNQSLGLGEYVMEFENHPQSLHHHLVAAAFLYQAEQQEYDIEYAKWGVPDSNNSQVVIQPWNALPGAQRYNVTEKGAKMTHRLRWSGSQRPSQVVFEAFAQDGSLMFAYTGESGNMITPGSERLHLNHWIYRYWLKSEAELPPTSRFLANCFKFCPLGKFSSCTTPLGIKPTCTVAVAHTS